MKIYYGGHSSFMLESKDRKILIDPMMLEGIPDGGINLIALTHAHGDHMGDAAELAKKNGCPVMAVFELANYLAAQGVETADGHIGGKLHFDFGWIKFVPAWHGSSLDGRYMGMPCGFIINLYGTTVYHAGDTGLFGDMQLIARQTPVDVFLCPIGDKYTMGPEDALKAVELVRPRIVIPMHYNTFPPIKQDPEAFAASVQETAAGTEAWVMKPGENRSL